MKMIDSIISALAGMAFLLGLLSLEHNIVGASMAIILSGSYLICTAWLKEEEAAHNRREKR